MRNVYVNKRHIVSIHVTPENVATFNVRIKRRDGDREYIEMLRAFGDSYLQFRRPYGMTNFDYASVLNTYGDKTLCFSCDDSPWHIMWAVTAERYTVKRHGQDIHYCIPICKECVYGSNANDNLDAIIASTGLPTVISNIIHEYSYIANKPFVRMKEENVDTDISVSEHLFRLYSKRIKS